MPDPLVQRFVEARDLAAAEAELQRLIEGHTLPLAEAIGARSLRSFSNDAALDRRDRHDVVGDALATLIDRQVINLRLSARKRLSNRVTSVSKGVKGSA